MWRPSSDDEPEETDEAPDSGVPEPTGSVSHIEPRGRDLTDRAKQRDGDRAALERLANEIYKSLAECARKQKYERKRDL